MAMNQLCSITGRRLCCVQVLPRRSRFWFWVLNPILHWLWGGRCFLMLCTFICHVYIFHCQLLAVQWLFLSSAFCCTLPWHPHHWYYYSIACVELFIMASINAYNTYVVWYRILYTAMCSCYKECRGQPMQNNGAYCFFVRPVVTTCPSGVHT